MSCIQASIGLRGYSIRPHAQLNQATQALKDKQADSRIEEAVTVIDEVQHQEPTFSN